MFAITSTALVTQMILSSVVTKIVLFGQGAVMAMRRLDTGGTGVYPLFQIGMQDRFGQSGKPLDVLRKYGPCADRIAARVKQG